MVRTMHRRSWKNLLVHSPLQLKRDKSCGNHGILKNQYVQKLEQKYFFFRILMKETDTPLSKATIEKQKSYANNVLTSLSARSGEYTTKNMVCGEE